MNILAPYRIAHTYTQQLCAPPERVFPLLCPVREAEWVNGWDPSLVVTASGVAEEGCAFVTGPEDNEAVWVVTHYEPPVRIEFLKITPKETVARISIVLRAGKKNETLADVTYEHTALTQRGVEIVNSFTAAYYTRFMREWEAQLNHYLKTGVKAVAN